MDAMNSHACSPADDLTHMRDSQLIAHGFEPVAVLGKAPVADGWQTGAVTDERIAAQRAASPEAKSTGLRTGKLVGVDIDVLDPAHAQQFANLAATVLGSTKFGRVGKKGVMLCYANPTPIKKITVAAKNARVEVLGAGQQFVAYGDHPDTGAPYAWIGEDELGRVDPLAATFDIVPLTTPDKLHEFAAACAKIFSELGYGVASVSGVRSDQIVAKISSGKRVSWAGLRKRLSHIHPQFDGARPDCYPAASPMKAPLSYDGDAWLAIALCLRDGEVPLLDTAEHDWLALVEEWSSGALWAERTGHHLIVTTFPVQGIEARLRGSRREGGVSTIATIVAYAADGGCSLPPDDEPAFETFKGPALDAALLSSETALAPEPALSKRSRYHFVDGSEMDAEPPPRWLIPELIQERSTVLMVGETGSYKSFLALEIALAVATGRETFGSKVSEPGLTFYAAAEGLSAVKGTRRRAWEAAREITGSITNFHAGTGATDCQPQRVPGVQRRDCETMRRTLASADRAGNSEQDACRA